MIRIVTDSVASLPSDVVESLGVSVASLFVHHRGYGYVDAEMDVDDFYSRIGEMVDDIPTSSQPTQHSLEELFESIAEAGDELLGVFMSSKMSGTFDGAVRAAEAVRSRYPDFRFRIIDSTTNSYDEAFCVLAAARRRDEGATLDECAREAALTVQRSRFLFTPETLAFLQAGGRIGKASALLASIVKIRPVITVKEGESYTFAKVRTVKKALSAIARKLAEDASEFGLRDAVVHYIGASRGAREWARAAVEPIVGRAVRVLPVSPVIGCHVGPAIGVAYTCDHTLEGKIDVPFDRLIYGQG